MYLFTAVELSTKAFVKLLARAVRPQVQLVLVRVEPKYNSTYSIKYSRQVLGACECAIIMSDLRA